MVEDEPPRYISKQWGLLDIRRFEALYKQICDENLHMPGDPKEVETDFNNLVDRLVFGEVQLLHNNRKKGSGIRKQFRNVIQIFILKNMLLL